MAFSSRRTGILVVRVWVEDHPVASLRARVTSSLDLTAGPTEEIVAASVDDVCAVVNRWLHAFLASPPAEPLAPDPDEPS
jgi:hypothetical protein